MKLIRTLTLIAAATALCASVAAAHPAARVDRREARQQLRIAHGVRCGDLTRGEVRRLRAGQHRVRIAERRAKGDGRVTLRERHRLERMQDRQSRVIHRLRHNGRPS